MRTTEIIYGVSPVLEALRAGRRACHEVLISLQRRESTAALISKEAALRRVPVNFVTRADITKRAGTDKHQGVTARVDLYPYAELEPMMRAAVERPEKAFLLILDGICDPRNLGSLIRTAYLMGVHGAVIPRDNAAGMTPSAVKASAGASEYLPVAQVTNLARTLRHLKESGIWVAGIESEGGKPIYSNNFKGISIAVVLGSEGSGMRRLVKESCDFLANIPMSGKISSYNVSVAGALAMGEVARQRSEAYCKNHTE